MKTILFTLALLLVSCSAIRLKQKSFKLSLVASDAYVTNDATGKYLGGRSQSLYLSSSTSKNCEWSLYSTTYNSQTYHILKNEY